MSIYEGSIRIVREVIVILLELRVVNFGKYAPYS